MRLTTQCTVETAMVAVTAIPSISRGKDGTKSNKLMDSLAYQRKIAKFVARIMNVKMGQG